jgi:DNA primase large subunit
MFRSFVVLLAREVVYGQSSTSYNCRNTDVTPLLHLLCSSTPHHKKPVITPLTYINRSSSKKEKQKRGILKTAKL